ncbi:Kelch repeat-containing protein [Methanosphaerula palustris]|uniref:PKD domain containing protein n=1 Tax=Methanosphaerula palustris (strain ATCC BAA-1556 / DSM 19958 / E1-9c) TaxID=521011 RepID=B8GI28_METPE|nr:kelch repeat-containing protein [Methanosphaerula palustris]ACL16768.1 PKD domain containing protein [Methanosphaerula palustris E1-9c]
MNDHQTLVPARTVYLLIAALLLLVGTASAAAPIAAFTSTPAFGTVPLTVNFTDTSTGSPTGWAWFFGDETYTQPWIEQNTSSGWSKRGYIRSVAMPDGSIVLMGGYGNSTYLNDTWRSTDNGKTWTEQNPSSGWSGRAEQSCVAMPDGSIVLMGGYGNGTFLNDTWRSTDNGRTWTEQNSSSGWSGRIEQSSVAMLDGSIILMGGYDGNSNQNDVWRSTDFGVTWTQLPDAAWSPRSCFTVVVTRDSSIVLTTGVELDGTWKNDVWRSTDGGLTWTEMTPSASWEERRWHGCVAMPDGSIVLMGGDGPVGWNDVWRSIDDGATWTQLPDAAWSPRARLGCVAMTDGSIVVMGGGGQNDTWRFQPAGSTLQNPSHTYTTAGTYSVALQAFTAAGYSSTHQVSVAVVPMPSISPSVNTPQDLNHDGLYEDLDGNGVFDFNDVVLFFNQMDWIADYEPVTAFDFDRNGRIDFNDIVVLFTTL